MAGLVGSRNVTNAVNNLINARSVFLILGSKRGRLIDRKFRGIYTPSIVHLGLGRLEILIALSNPNIDVRILGQGYCVAIVSLSFL